MRIKIIFICFVIVLCQTAHQNAYTTITNPVENSVQTGKSEIVKELQAIILEQEWRLFSLVFSVMPPDGYTIEFLSSGEVVTKNLAFVKTWSISYDGTLDLFDAQGSRIYIFVYDSREGIFVHTIPNGGMKGKLIVIAPSDKSFDFISYLQRRREYKKEPR